MRTKKGFTIFELLIVVSILGILSAIVIPEVQDHVLKAKESNAAGNLRELRNAIELFSIRNDGLAPGYDSDGSVSAQVFESDLIDGGYLAEIPENPFNESNSVQIISDAAVMPSQSPGGRRGWVYNPKTKEIRLDWPGADSKEMSYYGY